MEDVPDTLGEPRAHDPGATGGDEAPPEPLPGLPKRILDVFFSPAALFERLKHEPRWAAALVVGALLVVASTLAVPTDLFVENMRQAMLESGGEMPEGFDPTAFGAVQKGAASAFAGVFWFLMAVAAAGVTTLVFSFLLGDEGHYRQHLAIVAHAFLVMAVGGLLITPLRIVQGDLQASLNVGLFFPMEEGYIATFLRMLDLFMLWAAVLIGIGMHALDRRRPVGVAVAVLLVFPIAVAAVLATFVGG